MFYVLTHGFGKDPKNYITTEYKDYAKAKASLSFLFDIYQKALEDKKIPDGGSFVCILKTKGVRHNGKTEEKENSENNNTSEKANSTVN